LLLHPCAASQLVARLQAQTDGPGRLAGLSPRERATLELIGDGLTNRQIGDRLGVSEKTVKNYASTLFAKLGMKQRTQAAAYAARTFDGRATGMSQNMRMTARKP
jgi:DNA-binding NarL/FixJ family response regulator